MYIFCLTYTNCLGGHSKGIMKNRFILFINWYFYDLSIYIINCFCFLRFLLFVLVILRYHLMHCFTISLLSL